MIESSCASGPMGREAITRRHLGLHVEGVRQQQWHEHHLGDSMTHQFLDDLEATGRAVVEKRHVNIKFRSNCQQTLADLMADLRHLRVMASVADED